MNKFITFDGLPAINMSEVVAIEKQRPLPHVKKKPIFSICFGFKNDRHVHWDFGQGEDTRNRVFAAILLKYCDELNVKCQALECEDGAYD